MVDEMKREAEFFRDRSVYILKSKGKKGRRGLT